MIEASSMSEQFSAAFQGRAGVITYSEPSRSLEIYWEMSGSPKFDILVNADFRHWSSDTRVQIPLHHQLQILRGLRAWLKGKRLRSDIDEPGTTVEEAVACLWRECAKNRLVGYAYCKDHYDMSCLLT